MSVTVGRRTINMASDFSPYDDPARRELVKIMTACNISNEDRLILYIDQSDQPVIEVQKLTYPLGRFFKSVTSWRLQRMYKAATYDRLLSAVKANPEWLTFDTVFQLERVTQ